ncbi:hypothetical protein LJR027_003624 [Terrabacter sp. LjRoot27]|uniref:hypothetical protein n=1 Tax=Terrabacter sp. LjRoot27 TaxID=3342306 RepID=UPI003ECE451D
MTGLLGDGGRGDDRDALDRLVALEAEVRVELAVADASPALGAFSSPESEWLVDPAEVQTEQTGLRSLLGAVQALEAGRDPR